MICSTCFKDSISCPSAPIKVNTILLNGTYYWIIKDAKGNTYSQKIVYSGGDIEIDTDALPAGLFNADAGVFLIELRFGSPGGQLQELLFCDFPDYYYSDMSKAGYDCIELTIVSPEDYEKEEIGEDCT